MNDDQSGEPIPEPDATSGTTALGDSQLLMVGGAVILAGFLVFAVIMGEFMYSAVFISVAAIVVMAVRRVGGLTLGNGTLRLLGYFMGLVGAALLIADLRFGFPSGVADNLANATFYVGCLLMFLGARGLEA